MALRLKWALVAWLCLGCSRPAPPETFVLPQGLAFPQPASEASSLQEPIDIDKIDLLSLIPHLWMGRPPCARVPPRHQTALALRVHREVLAMEEALPAERASLEDRTLRFYLHLLAFDLGENGELGGPPFYDHFVDRTFSTHMLRAAQLVRLEPELQQAPLAVYYAEYLALGLQLVARGGPFADEDLLLEALRSPLPER